MDYLLLLSRVLMTFATFCLLVALTRLTVWLCRLVKEDLIRSIESERYDFERENNN